MGIIKFLLCVFLPIIATSAAELKLVCYYNNKAHFREGQAKFDLNFIDPALQLCTHLVYGYAGISPDNYKVVPLYENLDVQQNNYKHVTELKRKYSGLKVLLSVGGNQDLVDNNAQYTTILESEESRRAFVNSAQELVNNYGFDGLDLSWEFPTTKPKKIHSEIGKFFVGLKHQIFGASVTDENAEQHKQQFTSLVRELKNTFSREGQLLTLSVLPNVNSSVYFDIPTLAPQLDFITLEAFDFYTPQRNPKESDYTAPLYELTDRRFDENVDYQVKYWLQQGAPTEKIILGISTYGRAWKMDEDSARSGEPPIGVDGAAEAGSLTQEEGCLSYPEICQKLANPERSSQADGKQLRKVGDASKRKGTFAFRLPDENGDNGIWVGYDDPDTVEDKASYARSKKLGGVALVDITMDDFRGLCVGEKYPLLRAAKIVIEK